MSFQDEILQLDRELKELNLPFDKGLPILRQKVWALADRYGMTGPEVLQKYFDWKSTQVEHE